MFRTGCVCRNEGQADLRSGHAGKFDFCFFRRFFQSLHCHFVGTQVNALFLFEFVGKPVDNALVKIVTAQAVVTGSCQNLLHAVAHFDDGNIKGTAAEVVHHHLLVIFFINAVSERRRCRLIDDALDIQARDFARVLGRLTLCVGEIGGNGDNRLGHGATEIGFCVAFEFLQNHCGNLLRGVVFAVDGDFIIRPHMAFNGRHRAFGIGDCLPFCDLPDHSFAVFRERHNGRGGSCTLCVCDNHGLAALDDRHAGIGCT